MTRRKITKNILSFVFALATPLVCLSALGTTNVAQATTEDNAITSYSTFEKVTNGSFADISSTYASKNVNGWSLIRSNTSATTMIIDVDKNFSSYSSRPYCISNLVNGNPSKKGADNKILMINSGNVDNNPGISGYVPQDVHEGYKSDSLSLSANSYYGFQVSYKTATFENVSANPFASIYLTGLVNEAGEEISLSYEMISSTTWDTAYFFVATGETEQKVNLELWLGTEEKSSFGAAFFDEIYVQRFSQNIFYQDYYKDHYDENNFYASIDITDNTDSNGYTYNNYGENTSYENSDKPLVTLCELDERSEVDTIENLDFEKDTSLSLDTLVDWEINKNLTTTGKAQVININSASTFKATVGSTYAYPGSNLSYNNTNALVLWTTPGTTGTIALGTENIEIKAHECLKITAYVKVSSLVSGSFELVVKENDTIFSNFPELSESSYKTMSKSASVSANGSEKYNNEYAEVSIYVQGHDLYNSSINAYLALGNTETPAEGCVVIDNVRIERVNYEAYSSASNQLKLTSYADQSSTTIPNAYFNNAYSKDKVSTYPFTAGDWTTGKDKVDTGLYSGVINLYDDYFKNFKTSNSWASTLANPAKDKTDSNNVYMLYNARESYQSIKSSVFSLSKDGYYMVEVDFMTIKTLADKVANLTLEVYTDDDMLIYTDTLTSSSNWSTYKAYIYAGESSSSAYAVLSFGKSSSPCQGIAYIDSVKLEDSSKDAFDTAVKKADLSNFMLNLDPTNSIDENITKSLAFGGASTETDGGFGGIIRGKNNKSFGHVKDNGEIVDTIDDGSLENNVLVIQTTQPNSYSLTSNFDITLEATTYYKLSFRLLTSLPAKNTDAEESENAYGVSIGLKDLELAEHLVFNDGWTDCTIYFYNAESSSLDTNLVFTLTSTSHDNIGYAYLTDLVWAEKDENDESFESAFANAENDSEYGKTTFTSTYKTTTEDDPSTDTSTDTDTTDEENNEYNPLTVLIAVSSGITGLAVVIAVILFFLRKIKIKKIQKTRIESYDRNAVVDNSYIVSEANKIIKEETLAIEEAMEEYKVQIAALEEKQKENIALSRKQNGKITKDIEKEFKSYANKRAKIQEKLNILNERLTNIKSDEYMISLQRKIALQKIREKKAAEKKIKNAKKEK